MALFNSNSLQNHAPEDVPRGWAGQVANMGCPALKECEWYDKYALMDIREGDEFLCDYDEFVDVDLWEEFGL